MSRRQFSAYAALALLLLCPPAYAQSARTIADATFQSVVLVTMEDAKGRPVAMASGFVIRDDLVVTNFHVIREAFQGHVKIVGERAAYGIAGVASMDRAKDLAVLKITGFKAPSLRLGADAEVRVGDKIYAVGNPLGLEGTFSDGIISGIRRRGANRLFQITAPISPGSSGGPILNASGQVIGIAVSTLTEGQNINFAIPVSELEPLVVKLGRLLPLPKSAVSVKSETPASPLPPVRPAPSAPPAPPVRRVPPAPPASSDSKDRTASLRADTMEAIARYRATLLPVLEIYERELQRQIELDRVRRDLYEKGSLSESEMRQGNRGLAVAQRNVDQTRRDLEEVERMLKDVSEGGQPQRRR